MSLARRHSVSFWLALVLVAALLSPVSVAFAAPGGTAAPVTSDPEIEAKKAERDAALAELERMKADLANNMAQFVALGRRIDRTKIEADGAAEQIEAMSVELEQAEKAVEDRAIEIYRSDRLGMVQLLFTANSIPELLDRMSYLVAVSRRDAQLITRVKLDRQEKLWLEETLDERLQLLSELQVSAEEQRSRIESDLAAQETRAAQIGADIARLLREKSAPRVFAGGEPIGDFSPDTVISDALFRDTTSMTTAEVQKFLDGQPGSLKTYRALDHAGVDKSAAEMIAEAATAHGVSPKVVLVTLQKEQSLLSRATPTQRAYDWAMGCGKADSRTFYQYQGFGRQIWFGAQKLSENAGPWKPGISMKIDGSAIGPTNSSTYSLYKYTPHFRGTMSFWMLYWRYFGDPLGIAAPVLP